MATKVYVSTNGRARNAKGIYVGVNKLARAAEKIYVGDAAGKARLCYEKYSDADVCAVRAYFSREEPPREIYIVKKGHVLGSKLLEIYEDAEHGVLERWRDEDGEIFDRETEIEANMKIFAEFSTYI